MAATVDVVIASYNHGAFIGAAIESVLANDVPLHLWIVDDGSSDNSQNILEAIDDPRVTVSFNNRNIGAAETFNRGFSMGTAPFVAICNSDDLWAPDKLLRQLDAIGSSKAEKVAFSLAKFIGPDGGTVPEELNSYNPGIFICPQDWDRHDWLRQLLLRRNRICTPSFLGPRAVLDKSGFYNNAFRNLPDMELWTRVFQYADPVILPEELVCFRFHGKNTSAEQDRAARRLTRRRRSWEKVGLDRLFFRHVRDEVFAKAFLRSAYDPGQSVLRQKIIWLMAQRAPHLQQIGSEIAIDAVLNDTLPLDFSALDLHALHARTEIS